MGTIADPEQKLGMRSRNLKQHRLNYLELAIIQRIVLFIYLIQRIYYKVSCYYYLFDPKTSLNRTDKRNVLNVQYIFSLLFFLSHGLMISATYRDISSQILVSSAMWL